MFDTVLSGKLERTGASADRIQRALHVLDPNALTLGFARRFTAYKRPTLLLFDEKRFIRLLCDAKHPVQLIVAGKPILTMRKASGWFRLWRSSRNGRR